MWNWMTLVAASLCLSSAAMWIREKANRSAKSAKSDDDRNSSRIDSVFSARVEESVAIAHAYVDARAGGRDPAEGAAGGERRGGDGAERGAVLSVGRGREVAGRGECRGWSVARCVRGEV